MQILNLPLESTTVARVPRTQTASHSLLPTGKRWPQLWLHFRTLEGALSALKNTKTLGDHVPQPATALRSPAASASRSCYRRPSKDSKAAT